MFGRFRVPRGNRHVPARGVRRLSLTLLAALGAIVTSASAASAAVVYDSIPNPLPGNVPSQAYQATQTAEFGGQVGLASTQRQDPAITLTLSSWACESDPAAACTTTPGETFSHPLTLNLYSVLPSGEPGGLIASVTQAFDIPFRPSQSAICGDRRWSSDGTLANCFNGFANNVTFDLAGRGVSLPDRVIVALAFNTQTWGEDPIGADGPYNSLNWGLPPDPPSVGTLPRPDDAYWNTMTASNYCDGGAGGVGTFRLDEATVAPACNWTGFQPAIQVDANDGSTATPPGTTTPAGGTAGAVGQGGTKAKCKKKKAKKGAVAAKKCKRKKKS